MRLSKTVELVAGITISGGILLALSGGAFAAEGGVGTITQTTEKPTSSASNSTPAGATTGDTDAATDVKLPSAGTSEKAADAGAVTDLSKPPTALSPDSQTVPAQTTVTAKVAGVAIAADGTPIKPLKNDIKTEGKVAGAIVPIEKTDKVTVGEPVAGVAGVATAVTEATTTPTEITNRTTMLINSTVLPIQPKITTAHPLVIQDLAALVPTAPERQSDPSTPAEPSQSSGLLSRLTAGLAGSVVPPVFLTPALGYAAQAIEFAAILVLCLLTLGRVALNFGDFSRSGGFAHAARSDVGESANLIFATPLALSYEPAHLPEHSSFLVVSETKTVRLSDPNAFRKEEMR